MNQLIYHDAVDKTGWPDGPWLDEPDKIQWVDAETGLDCLIVRGPVGALCGYVGVSAGHPAHGIGCSQVTVPTDVHGGLTYADACDEDAAEATGICHIPFEGRPRDVWWLGFDCSHVDDYCPGYPGRLDLGRAQVYRNVDYVRLECAVLAVQLESAVPA